MLNAGIRVPKLVVGEGQVVALVVAEIRVPNWYLAKAEMLPSPSRESVYGTGIW
jgi:hypothetical protein